MLISIDENLINENLSIEEAINALNNLKLKLLFVVNSHNQLLGTLTDGDIRRATLKGIEFKEKLSKIMQRDFISFDQDTSPLLIQKTLNERNLLAIPILDEEKIISGIHISEGLNLYGEMDSKAIIMAGGFGSRLGHLTESTPKPLLKIGNKPMLEIIIENLRRHGIKNFIITTHYLSEMIVDYFKDGKEYGINIDYLHEKEPLGTAGCIHKLQKKGISGNNIIINSDVITEVDFQKLLLSHEHENNCLTACVREYLHDIPFGIVESKSNNKIVSISEKPNLKFDILAGIYMVNFDLLPKLPNEYLDMPDLIKSLISKKKNVSTFKLNNYWLDIGQIDDFKKAQIDYLNK